MLSAGRRRLTQLKPDVVQLINEHYLPLGRQIAICLPALVPSVLLLIEENDEKIRNMSIACVDAIVGVGEACNARSAVAEWSMGASLWDFLGTLLTAWHY